MAQSNNSNPSTLVIGGIVTTLVVTVLAIGIKNIKHYFKSSLQPSIISKNPKVFLSRELQPVTLQEKIQISPNTFIFRFALPSMNHILGLPVGKHIRITCPNTLGKNQGKWNTQQDTEVNNQTIDRKYTPISTTNGSFDLLIKVYNPTERFLDGGKMTYHYLNNLKINDKINISGPFGLIEYKSNGTISFLKNTSTYKYINMICGGSGITPMYQIIMKALYDKNDTTKFFLIYANQTIDDILLHTELNELKEKFPERFNLWYTIDRKTENEEWEYDVGFVNKDMIQNHFSENNSAVVMLCGPPPMIKFACHPNLEALGWRKEQVLEF